MYDMIQVDFESGTKKSDSCLAVRSRRQGQHLQF